jgi:hypothetical protein
MDDTQPQECNHQEIKLSLLPTVKGASNKMDFALKLDPEKRQITETK